MSKAKFERQLADRQRPISRKRYQYRDVTWLHLDSATGEALSDSRLERLTDPLHARSKDEETEVLD